MKRLSTRLQAIEAAARPDGGLSGPEKSMLVSVLARRDALFWPWRFQSGSNTSFPEIRRRQKEYLAGVAGVSARADGRNQWKTACETRQGLIAAGMLTTVGANGETVSVILTPQGEATGRALVGERLATNVDATVSLAFMRVFSKPPGSPVRESVLFGMPCVGDPSDWEHRTERLLPLLTAGVVRADSDTQGRVLFSLTGRELPEFPVVTTEAEDSFDGLYLRVYDSERGHLTNVEARDPAEICTPVSASLYWPKVGDDTDAK